jgi:hypothetical protein
VAIFFAAILVNELFNSVLVTILFAVICYGVFILTLWQKKREADKPFRDDEF